MLSSPEQIAAFLAVPGAPRTIEWLDENGVLVAGGLAATLRLTKRAPSDSGGGIVAIRIDAARAGEILSPPRRGA